MIHALALGEYPEAGVVLVMLHTKYSSDLTQLLLGKYQPTVLSTNAYLKRCDRIVIVREQRRY